MNADRAAAARINPPIRHRRTYILTGAAPEVRFSNPFRIVPRWKVIPSTGASRKPPAPSIGTRNIAA